MSFCVNQCSEASFDFKIDQMLQSNVNTSSNRLDETVAVIYLRQITYKLLKDAPEEPLKNRTVALMGERQTLPSTPRFSGRTAPHVKFFDADPPVRSNEKVEQTKADDSKEDPSEHSKDTVVAPVNRASEDPRTILKKRRTESMSIEQFEKKMTQGRILRCIKLFEGGANRNGIRLMKTFSDETQEELLRQLREGALFSFAVELELITISGGELPTWEFNRCFKLFKEEKHKEGMLWAVVLTESQRESLIEKLIKSKKFNAVVKVGTLLTQDNMEKVCSRLIQEKQYDHAMYLICELRYTHQNCFLEQCVMLIQHGQYDLAMKLAVSKLNAAYKVKFCEVLASAGQFEKVVELALLIDSQSQIAEICKNLIKQGHNALAAKLAIEKLNDTYRCSLGKQLMNKRDFKTTAQIISQMKNGSKQKLELMRLLGRKKASTA